MAKVQSRRIEKYFDDKNLQMLCGNTLSFVDESSEELLDTLKEVYESIKRANPNIKSFNPSIMLLFSSIAEVFYLHKDRETYAKQKQEIYDDWIEDFENQIKENKKIIYLSNQVMEESKYKSKEWFEWKFRKLDAQKQNGDLKTKIKSAKRSKYLKMFEVSKNGKIFVDITSQILSKNERLLKLMKDFGINPTIVDPNIIENKNSKGLGLGVFNESQI